MSLRWDRATDWTRMTHARLRGNYSRCRSARFTGGAMKSAHRRGLARNAVVLGNVGTADDVPLLEAALQHDEPLVREYAAWH